MLLRVVALAGMLLGLCTRGALAQNSAPASAAPHLRAVVIVGRHGVRSPTDFTELNAYAARAWPVWEVAPGYLTPHGAAAERQLGAAFRSLYAAAGLVPGRGCPGADSVYVWADVDERTKATGAALLDGLAPQCGLIAHDAGAKVDPIFHALPTVGKADAALGNASIAGSLGPDPNAIVAANGAAFAKLDRILGCGAQRGCTQVSRVPVAVTGSPKTGLTGLEGAVDLASTAVEDFILAYADGKPLSDVGWGAVDRSTLLDLSTLHVLKGALTTQTPYIARVQGSNLLAHVVAAIDEAAGGAAHPGMAIPDAARFIAFVGHDTNLEEFTGMLRLRWLLPGYQPNDTPPGGALVFEILQRPGESEPFVRVFYTAQSLEQLRSAAPASPGRAPVFVPGCPSLDCPLHVFDAVTAAAIDPAFVKW